MGDTWCLDELFGSVQGQWQYLWRAVDQDGDVIDIRVQPGRDRQAAAWFFRKLLKGQGREPRCLMTDKLPSYAAAHRTVMPSVGIGARLLRTWASNRRDPGHLGGPRSTIFT